MNIQDTLKLIIAIVIGYALLFLTMWLFRSKKNHKEEKKK